MPPEIREASGRLCRSLAQLADSTAGYVGARIDQADSTLQAERRRWLWIAMSASAALLCLGAAALFAGAAIVIAYWDSHPVLAVAAVSAGFLVLAATAGWVLWRFAHRRAPLAVRLAAYLALVLERQRLLR